MKVPEAGLATTRFCPGDVSARHGEGEHGQRVRAWWDRVGPGALPSHSTKGGGVVSRCVGYLRRQNVVRWTDATKPELLAPAGDWDCARAAVANGADAVYFGLPAFNARMRGDQFHGGRSAAADGVPARARREGLRRVQRAHLHRRAGGGGGAAASRCTAPGSMRPSCRTSGWRRWRAKSCPISTSTPRRR